MSDEVAANRRRVTDTLFAELKVVGFTQRKASVAWRQGLHKIDAFKAELLTPMVCQKWHVPAGSFYLEPGCFFPYIPSLNAKKICEDQSTITQPWIGLCQIRLSIHKSSTQREVEPPNIWWPGNRPEQADAVIADVLAQVRNKALPFYARFDDPAEVLRTFIEEKDVLGTGNEGLWDFGKEDSLTRLFYIGFAALECQRWDLARESLSRCLEKKRALSFESGPDIIRCIERGLKQAEQASVV